MYGRLVRVRPTQGNQDALRALLENQQARDGTSIDGFVAQFMPVPDDADGELLGLIIFSSPETYRKNAGSAEQHRRYEEMRTLLESDPEWLDGEIIPLEPSIVSL